MVDLLRLLVPRTRKATQSEAQPARRNHQVIVSLSAMLKGGDHDLPHLRDLPKQEMIVRVFPGLELSGCAVIELGCRNKIGGIAMQLKPSNELQLVPQIGRAHV